MAAYELNAQLLMKKKGGKPSRSQNPPCSWLVYFTLEQARLLYIGYKESPQV